MDWIVIESHNSLKYIKEGEIASVLVFRVKLTYEKVMEEE